MEWFLIREWPAVDCTVGSGFLWQPLPIGIYIVPVTDDDDKVALVKETQVEAASSSSEHNVETVWLPASCSPPFPTRPAGPGCGLHLYPESPILQPCAELRLLKETVGVAGMIPAGHTPLRHEALVPSARLG